MFDVASQPKSTAVRLDFGQEATADAAIGACRADRISFAGLGHLMRPARRAPPRR